MVLPITWNIPILPKLCKNYIKKQNGDNRSERR